MKKSHSKNEMAQKMVSSKIGGMKMEKMKPSLMLSSEDLPELKEWKVGETYDLKVSVKQVSMGMGGGMMPMDMEGHNDKMRHARFEVLSVSPLKKDTNSFHKLAEKVKEKEEKY